MSSHHNSNGQLVLRGSYQDNLPKIVAFLDRFPGDVADQVQIVSGRDEGGSFITVRYPLGYLPSEYLSERPTQN